MADEKNPLPTVSPITVPADSTNDSNMNELGSLIQGVLQQTQDRFQHMWSIHHPPPTDKFPLSTLQPASSP
ncbi:hypothetical protein L5515_012905 [Caenorhabditis briggsae]|uniref:Uncharacterized protein n=1 Tax=Caenorhabditis briggsae TaxID=6238 RepID=A0AAE9D815_CAEBR|nr:hypothetical protein L3Y34_005819 [Caenorhabditis briggsae]UMM31428.1 hypothetical protein L5515_012905 [Caenorhabditis briggsae]